MKKVKQYYIIKSNLVFGILLLVFQGIDVQAQEVISTSGGSYKNSTTTIDFSVGELMISTLSTNQVVVTQGFHQSFKATITTLEPSNFPIEVSVFPNPTSDYINISTEDFSDEIAYRLYNINGVLISQGTFSKNTKLSINSYTKGFYQLLLTNSNQQLIQTFKILLK